MAKYPKYREPKPRRNESAMDFNIRHELEVTRFVTLTLLAMPEVMREPAIRLIEANLRQSNAPLRRR
jgi:hypothetical protein